MEFWHSLVNGMVFFQAGSSLRQACSGRNLTVPFVLVLPYLQDTEITFARNVLSSRAGGREPYNTVVLSLPGLRVDLW